MKEAPCIKVNSLIFFKIKSYFISFFFLVLTRSRTKRIAAITRYPKLSRLDSLENTRITRSMTKILAILCSKKPNDQPRRYVHRWQSEPVRSSQSRQRRTISLKSQNIFCNNPDDDTPMLCCNERNEIDLNGSWIFAANVLVVIIAVLILIITYPFLRSY